MVKAFYLCFLSVHFFTDLETAQDPRSVSGKFNLHIFPLPLRSVKLWESLKNASQELRVKMKSAKGLWSRGYRLTTKDKTD